MRREPCGIWLWRAGGPALPLYLLPVRLADIVPAFPHTGPKPIFGQSQREPVHAGELPDHPMQRSLRNKETEVIENLKGYRLPALAGTARYALPLGFNRSGQRNTRQRIHIRHEAVPLMPIFEKQPRDRSRRVGNALPGCRRRTALVRVPMQFFRRQGQHAPRIFRNICSQANPALPQATKFQAWNHCFAKQPRSIIGAGSFHR
jgi:hypothetical protein